MAIKHRKLYPTNENNQTTTCLTGGDGCYPPYGVGDYYFPPPLQALPPPQPKSSGNGPGNTREITIAAALVGSFVLLLLSYYLVIVKNCFGWIRRRPEEGQPDGENQEFIDENRGPVIDHPIWYIRTIGLQPSVINTITIFRYKTGEKLIEGTECSVCLSEFQEDETLRLLPKCNHAFHIRCIDTWLRSHTNCPLCRAPIVSNAGAPARNSSPGSGIELVHADNRGAESNGERNDVEDGNRENRERVDEEEEEAQVQESDGDETGKTERTGNRNDNGLSWTGTRRSLSVGSSTAANVVGLVEHEENQEACLGDPETSESNTGRISRTQRTMGDGSIAECLHKKPVLMKRSFSYAGRPFFSRNQPNTPQN